MYKISEELLNEILRVLSAMPYAQVANVVQAIQQGVEPVSETNDETESEA